MNEQTAKLLEQLAAKLGTTAEYLWGVLIHQAQLAAITSLLYMLLVIVSGGLLLRAHFRLLNDDKEVSYESNDVNAFVMSIAGIIWAVFAGVVLINGIPSIINGLFNPEYWALDRILNELK